MTECVFGGGGSTEYHISPCLYSESFKKWFKWLEQLKSSFRIKVESILEEVTSTCHHVREHQERRNFHTPPQNTHPEWKESSKEKAAPLSETNVAAVGHFVLIDLDN